MAKKSESKKINIKLVKSLIGATKSQIKVVNALGLKKTNQVGQAANQTANQGGNKQNITDNGQKDQDEIEEDVQDI